MLTADRCESQMEGEFGGLLGRVIRAAPLPGDASYSGNVELLFCVF